MPAEPLTSSNQTRLIIFFSVAISLFLSALAITANEVLTPDSLLYIFTAQTFQDQGLQAAIDSYPWPFLSVLIANIQQITGLSMAASGHLLNSVLFAGLSCSFVLLTRALGGDSKLQLLALLVISISPTLNDYRAYITRDPGFWFFTLLSLLQLIRFALTNRFRHAAGWFAFTLLAISFRTEAMFFAALAPLALMMDATLTWQARLKRTLALYSLPFSMALIGISLALTSQSLTEKLRLITELANLFTFFEALIRNYQQMIEFFSEVSPYRYAASHMETIIGTGLIGLVIYTLLHALTFPYLVLLVWSGKPGGLTGNRHKYYLFTYLAIIVGYLLLLSFKKYLMSDRFCVTAILIVMLAVPFCIEKIWHQSPSKFNWRKIVIVLLLSSLALDSLINSGSSKKYISAAANWMQEHQPANAPLLTNSRQVAVIGANCWHECLVNDTAELIRKATQEQPALLAIQLEREEKEFITQTEKLAKTEGWALVKTFENPKGDRVLILSSRAAQPR